MNSVYLEKTVAGGVSLSETGKEVAQNLKNVFGKQNDQFDPRSKSLRFQTVVGQIMSGLAGVGITYWVFEGEIGTAARLGGVLIAVVLFAAFVLMDGIGRLRLANYAVCAHQQVRDDVKRILSMHTDFSAALRLVPDYSSLVESIDFALANDDAVKEAVLCAQGCSLATYHHEKVSSVNPC